MTKKFEKYYTTTLKFINRLNLYYFSQKDQHSELNIKD